MVGWAMAVIAAAVLASACGRANYDPFDAAMDSSSVDAPGETGPADTTTGDGGDDASSDADATSDAGPGCADALGEGLVASWTFDEMSETTAIDATGAGHDGTLLGTTSRIPGRVGSAASFPGIDDRVDVGSDPALGLQFPMTLTAWVRPDRLVDDARHSIFGRDDAVGFRQFEWGISDSRMPAITLYPDCISEGQVWVGADRQVRIDGAWTHVAVTFGVDFTVTHYIEGAEAGGGPLSRATICPEVISSSIGGTPYGPYPWDGAIDEVRFYDRVLSECEIAELRCLGTWHCADGVQSCGETGIDVGADC